MRAVGIVLSHLAARGFVAILGLVAALGLALGCDDRRDRTGESQLRRLIEPRLSGDFEHVECRPPPGTSGCPQGADLPLEQVLTWARDAAGESGGEAERRGAVAPLIGASDFDSLDRSVRYLERAVARHPASAATWNDYGAVLWARYHAGGNSLDAFQALEALGRATDLEADSAQMQAQIQFNRALVGKRLGLRAMAREAWRRAQDLETDPDWLREIEQRREALELQPTAESRWQSWLQASTSDDEPRLPRLPPRAVRDFPWRTQQRLVEEVLPRLASRQVGPDATELDALRAVAEALADRGDPLFRDVLAAWPSTGDSTLYRAIEDLGRGLRELESLELEAGEPAVGAARDALAAADHPLRWNAELGAVIALSYRDSPAALRRTGELLDGVPRYPSIRGRLHWLRGILEAREGEMARSARSYEAAAYELRPVYGEHPAAYVESLVGESAAYDGRAATAFEVFSKALPRLERHGDRRRLHSILTATGTALRTSGLHHAARFVYGEALDNARRWGDDYGLASSLRRWLIANRTTGRLDGLEGTLIEARDATLAIADPAIRELTLGDLAVEESRLHLELSAVAVGDRQRLGAALATFEASGSGFDVANARLAASRLEAELGDWHQALQTLDAARSGFQASEPRPLDRPGPLGSGLARSLELQRARALIHVGRPREALAAFERSRQAPSSSNPSSNDVVARALQLASQLDVHLLLLQEGRPALRYLVTASGLQADELSISSDDVQFQTSGFAALDAEAKAQRLELLGRWLLPDTWTPPKHLLVVADPDFDGIPFSALVHPGTGRQLVETTSTAHTASLHALLDRDEATRPPPRDGDHLLVAAPDAVSPSLPGARAEADVVAQYLHVVQPLVHPNAEALDDALRHARFFHFAGHSESRPLDPYRRELRVAPGQSFGMDRLLDIDLSRLQLVFLSSCDSASMVAFEQPGPGFADFFLQAGTRQVVGTLWPVEDGASLPLIREFYRQLSVGTPPLDALRAAQRVMREGDGSYAVSPDWMAYRVAGSAVEAQGGSYTLWSPRMH